MKKRNSTTTPTPDPKETALIHITGDGIIRGVNGAAAEMAGTTAPELVGRHIREFFPDCPGLDDFLAHGGFSSESRLFQADMLHSGNDQNENEPVLVSILPLPGPDSKYTGAVISLDSCAADERINHLLLDSIADGVFSIDRNWKITSFNRAAETITGWQAAEVLGRSCSDVFQASLCGRSCAMAESLYSGRAVSNRSLTIRGRNGEEIPVSISASPFIDRSGNIIGGVETFRDLSRLDNSLTGTNAKKSFAEIISNSQAMQKLFAIMPDIAASPSSVLITGESGTGKELMARALFRMSSRSSAPFIALNCGALPEALLESELFGYKAGAFTDARRDKEGRFAAAEGGTLFLDEVGDIPQNIQVKLLRVLQEKVYEPLGSNAPVKTDVRIITATNRDLEKLVASGQFREDLYYRLNVVRIQLPPLRERREDIPLLIDQFISEYRSLQGKDINGIARPALDILMSHDFPGNIRELKNIIEYAFILCPGGYILSEHLPEPFRTEALPESSKEVPLRDHPPTLEEIEKQAIYLALERNDWKKNAVCDELGISRDTLRRKLAKYNFVRSGRDEGDTPA